MLECLQWAERFVKQLNFHIYKTYEEKKSQILVARGLRLLPFNG